MLAIASFIFVNALLDAESSHRLSDVVWHFFRRIGGKNEEMSENTVRNIGHVLEYTAFGSVVMAFVLYLKARFQKSGFGFAFFAVLALAVLDEHLQSFSDRTSSTSDILLDFLGAMIGFTLVYFVVLGVRQIRKKKND